MHRSAPRLTRILACAAVPVMLVVAGCSSDSDSGSKKDSGSSSAASPDAKTSPTVAAARFAKLSDPCKSISAKTIAKLVPQTKVKAGTAGKSTDVANRRSCSWNGLDDNGVKGSQYRWLDVSFLRYDSESSLGVSGEQRAKDNYAKEIAKAKATEGAKSVRTSPATGVGEAGTAIAYDLKKTGEDFTYATILSRTGNVVVTLTYNGTGYAGAKSPASADLMKGAVAAAKEAVASVAVANK
ncbi:DUF3558 family protein [Streptomyces lunaelactis]|uniref:DUF3558 family protein n=1 Tax=Streptomyces lunaelactis TaxID=1535768 RepID=UPI001584E2BC|nr:DUF3558 family protein [Streptomyces lunaelactis]NUK04207.1 DUF3558 family protein [Streptomyces lunaelactis]NUK19514.1 DUF3558 family protein [Streptomyces lunaelactis]